MDNQQQYNRRVLKNYIIIACIFILLSLISLFFNEWILIINIFICSIFGYLTLVLLIKGGEKASDENSRGSMAVYTIIRYVLMIIGLLISALLIKLTMIDDNSKRYILVAISAIPYFVPTISLLLTKQ